MYNILYAVRVGPVTSNGVVCTVPTQIRNELSGRTSGGLPANYVAVACLLVRRGAAVDKENLEAIGCPSQTADLIASYA